MLRSSLNATIIPVELALVGSARALSVIVAINVMAINVGRSASVIYRDS